MGAATICERTGVKICITAILIAGFENNESGIDEINIGGRLIDPNMVIASRNKNVPATTLGNLFACAGEGCPEGFGFVNVSNIVFDSVGRP
jgi:hypothetical protein